LRGEDIDKTKYSNPDGDPRGPWFSADLTGLATKRQRPNLHYDVVNPKTGYVHEPSPTRGWGLSKENFQKLIEAGMILWPTKPDGRPRLKKFLKDTKSLQTSFSSMLDAPFTTEGTKEIQELFGEKILQFPKPVGLMKILVTQATAGNDLIMDFFAGSCTTAQAVLEVNHEDGGSRRYVMVQFPEETDIKKFPTIAEIGKERIRRVVKRMREAGGDDIWGKGNEDLGLRVFRLAESHFKRWTGVESTEPEAYMAQMEMFKDPLVEHSKDEHVIWEVALKEGYSLNSRIDRLPGIEENTVFLVSDSDKEQSFRICLDDRLKVETVKKLDLKTSDLFICRDVAIDDGLPANLALQCRLKTI
jgi:adenine-specific DNA-methyltransferase